MRGITIGQLAKYAGVTIKAVRHYHKLGLLKEPPRDVSGYRRYSAQHAIDLVKIKTLVDAGVPLVRIKELLTANPKQFAKTIVEIDSKLQERLDDLLRIRMKIAQLNSGDRLFISPQVADYLDQLREIGVSQRTVQLERDLWILVQSISPKDADRLINEKRVALNDPEFRSIYLAYDVAFSWTPNDSRLPALADQARRWFTNHPQRTKKNVKPVVDSTIVELIANSFVGVSPAWDRLSELAKASLTVP